VLQRYPAPSVNHQGALHKTVTSALAGERRSCRVLRPTGAYTVFGISARCYRGVHRVLLSMGRRPGTHARPYASTNVGEYNSHHTFATDAVSDDISPTFVQFLPPS